MKVEVRDLQFVLDHFPALGFVQLENHSLSTDFVNRLLNYSQHKEISLMVGSECDPFVFHYTHSQNEEDTLETVDRKNIFLQKLTLNLFSCSLQSSAKFLPAVLEMLKSQRFPNLTAFTFYCDLMNYSDFTSIRIGCPLLQTLEVQVLVFNGMRCFQVNWPNLRSIRIIDNNNDYCQFKGVDIAVVQLMAGCSSKMRELNVMVDWASSGSKNEEETKIEIGSAAVK
jgi:hypothetical protein